MNLRGKFLGSVCLVVAAFIPSKAKSDDKVKVMPPIQLEDTIRGISVPKRARFLVADIRIGGASVKDLFSNSDSADVSQSDYYSLKRETVTIRLKERRLLSRLKYLSLTDEHSYLVVILVDPRKAGALRWIREKASILFGSGFSVQLKYPIATALPICERVTQVILSGIDSHLQEVITKAGQAETSISLDQLFLLLRRDRLDSFMNKLGPIERQCPVAVRLLKWVRNDEVQGFEFKKYEVTPELGSILDSLSTSLVGFKKWQRYNFRVSIVGYTDPKAVQDPKVSRFLLSPAKTGVKSLASRSRLDVYYKGCDEDRPTIGLPQYVDFFSSSGRLVRSPIQTNCELGAVRAYAASAFVAERLGEANMEYEYATGGVSSSTGADEQKRKVEVKIVVKAAKKR